MSGKIIKIFFLVIILGLFLFLISKTNYNKEYYNKYNSLHLPWVTSIPESLGINSNSLYALADRLKEEKTDCFLFIKNEKILFEWYGDNYNADKKHFTASASKTLVGCLALLLALQDSLISLEDYACTYIPHWSNDSLKSKIKIKHLASHSSGLQDARLSQTISQKELPGWMGRYWNEKKERFKISLNDVPVLFEPGSMLDYSNTGVSSLSYIISKVLFSKNKDLKNYLNKKVYEILGLNKNVFKISYDDCYNYDGLSLYEIGGGGYFTARAAAKVVQLFVNFGKVNDTQIIDSSLVAKAIKNTNTDLKISEGIPSPGLFWWSNQNMIWKSLPKDAFVGMGGNHQIILGIPSQNIIVVRFGSTLKGINWFEYISQGYPAQMWADMDECIFNPIMESLQN